MRFYRCDRCKNEYISNAYGISEGTLGLCDPNAVARIIDLPVDLCDDCRKDFENWFRQPSVDKAFEEVYAKIHAHENGAVTPLGLKDGRVICPVCGLGVLGADVKHYEVCPSCGTPFNKGIHYVKFTKEEKENNNEQQSDAEKT